MEDEILEFQVGKIGKVKGKRWEHLPIRPKTFREFRDLRKINNNWKSDDAFVQELIRIYKMRLEFLAKKRLEKKNV
jgi:hypothetical protein